MVQIFKGLFYRFLDKSGINYLARKSRENSVLILTYHQVLPFSLKFKRFDYRNVVSTDAFSDQIKYLKNKYEIISLGKAVSLLSGEWQKANYAVITFDDGYRNNFTHAMPVLQAHGVTATFFITTGLMDSADCLWTDWVTYLLLNASNRTIDVSLSDRHFYFELNSLNSLIRASIVLRSFLKSAPFEASLHAVEQLKKQIDVAESPVEADPERYAFLTWRQIKAMDAAGMEIGSHTHHHALLSMLSNGQARLEIETSKKAIKKNLGKECDFFAYPNGGKNDFNEKHIAVLRELGFKAAVTQIPGVNRVGDNLFSLKRINISSKMTLPVFKAYVSGSYRKK